MLFIVLSENELSAQQRAEAYDPTLAGINVILVLDNSGSMKNNDPDFLIKAAVSAFAGDLNDNSMLAIVLFDTSAKVILDLSKLTRPDFDGLLMRALDQIDYRGQRTDIPDGLALALDELSKNGRSGANSVVVFLTDGIVDLGSRTKTIERSRFLHENLLPEIKRQGIRIYGVALSKAADLQLVQHLSSETGGDYYPVMAAAEILPAFQKIDSQLQALVAERVSGDETPTEKDSPAQPQQQPNETLTPVEGSVNTPTIQPADEKSVEPREELQEPNRHETTEGLPIAKTTEHSESQSGTIESAQGPMNEPANAESDLEEPVPITIQDNWLLISIGILALVLALIAIIIYWCKIRSTEIGQGSWLDAVLIDLSTPAEKSYPLGDEPIRIGRSARINDIVIDQSTVSSQHAIIDLRDGRYYLRDLGSTNGTYINDRKLGIGGQTSEIFLNNHDLISIARYRFRFHCKESEMVDFHAHSSKSDDQTVIHPTIVAGNHDRALDETVIGIDKSLEQSSMDVDRSPDEAMTGVNRSLDETLMCSNGSLDQTIIGYKPVRCPNHPDKAGNELCTICKQAFCTDCVSEQNDQLVCNECRRRVS